MRRRPAEKEKEQVSRSNAEAVSGSQAAKPLQAVWKTDVETDRLAKSNQGSASAIVPENLKIQAEAQKDGGEAMRASGAFSATGYEFEFAQLPRELRGTEFGKKSHLELARGPGFPLFPGIPFMAETDMSAVIELAMPPLLVPRDPGSKSIDRAWVALSMGKLERGLKALAKNDTEDLKAILASVQGFFGLPEPFQITMSPIESGGAKPEDIQYGFMEKNSRIRGKYTTAQANIVTSLEEAIAMAYDRDDLPAEIAVMKGIFDKLLKAGDPKHYGIFVAQKFSEIPYMFFDSLHAESLLELETSKDGPTFTMLQGLAGHDQSRLEKNKMHPRGAEDDPDNTKHTARSTVSRVKGRGFGWIKSTLGQQAHRLSPEMRMAAFEMATGGSGKVRAALEHTVAYRALLAYSKLKPEYAGIVSDYHKFVDTALAHIAALMKEVGSGKQAARDEEVYHAKHTREQKENPKERAKISSARPDTVINLDQKGVAYNVDEENDAVLVEIRKPTDSFGIPFRDRTTNKYSITKGAVAYRAREELKLFKDEGWVASYRAANPKVNTPKRIGQEIAIFERLAAGNIQEARRLAVALAGTAKLEEHVYWRRWFGGLPEK